MDEAELVEFQRTWAAAALDPTAPKPLGVDPQTMDLYAEILVGKRLAEIRAAYPAFVRQCPEWADLVRRWWRQHDHRRADYGGLMRSFGTWCLAEGFEPIRPEHLRWQLRAPGPWIRGQCTRWRIHVWVRGWRGDAHQLC